ncbi:MAG: methyltransferase family protein [Nitrospiraceae bacterium]
MILLIKNLLFVVVVPGTVAVYVPLYLARDQSAASGGTFAIAFALLLVGGAIFAWCVWDFAVFGRGTPAPTDPPKKLVVRGLYRYTRNPMYLSVLTVILGWAVLYQTGTLAIYALGLGACAHLFIVFYEEPHLRQVFGHEYDEYRAAVGRWFPRLPRKPTA